MPILTDLRAPLAFLTEHAAAHARVGHHVAAKDLKEAIDAIKRATCDHRDRAVRHVHMSGVEWTCGGCGEQRPDPEEEP